MIILPRTVGESKQGVWRRAIGYVPLNCNGSGPVTNCFYRLLISKSKTKDYDEQRRQYDEAIVMPCEQLGTTSFGFTK